MKNKKLLSSAAVAALCLPLAAFGQTSSGTTGSSSTGTDATANPYSTQSQRPTTNQQDGAPSMQGQQSRDQHTTARSQRDTQSTSSSAMTQRQGQSNQSGLQSSSVANIRKVKENSIEKKMTAERLLGKTVVDRDGEEIGEVKDIGLGSALSSSHGRSSSQSGLNQSSSMRQNSIGNETAATTQRDPARSSSGVSGVGSTSSSMMDREVHVYISTDDDMLLQVPLSELSFNERDDELRLNLAQSQLDSIRESTVASSD